MLNQMYFAPIKKALLIFSNNYTNIFLTNETYFIKQTYSLHYQKLLLLIILQNVFINHAKLWEIIIIYYSFYIFIVINI